ncbi:hypothetical protein A3A11_03080 [Candidatus Nomurabacteria bacterium RIFCSPLOWO2_01_FULL_43_15]|nr:MAG: hypothetical protein A3A11_03080 [Candidatus Nomurabacteria bacterium RIFCSPLOWO2_01_FULL_43_15]
MVKVPPQLILEKEVMNNQIKKVLFYHNTDRWYFGDLLRHSSWIESLGKVSKHLTVATNKNFLSIFENHPIVEKLIPVNKIKEKDFSKYDLVIISSSFSPIYYSSFIKRGIYSYNTALEYTRYGILIQKIKKHNLNYFDLAKHKLGQTYLPDGKYFKLYLTPREKLEAEKVIKKIFPSSEKIIIFNPTTSNTFTRETNIKKEVLNILTIKDYVSILKNLLREFPKYSILVASSLKPNDQFNFELIEKLCKLTLSKRVQAITSITTLKKGFSFREFASILFDKKIIAMVGNGTGTNTHLAATCGLPSMSIERSADRNMIRNWESIDLFKMGSFRWRNPELSTAIYVLNFSNKNKKNFEKIAYSLKLHLMMSNRKWQNFFYKKDINAVTAVAKKVLFLLTSERIIYSLPELNIIRNNFKNPAVKNFFFNFYDEIQYLAIVNNKVKELFKSIIYGTTNKSNRNISLLDEKLFLELIKNSNLYKLLMCINGESKKENIRKKDESKFIAMDILKKIRVGISLSKEELRKIGFYSETEFHKWINGSVLKNIDSVIKSYNQNKKHQVKGSWQQRVYINSKSSPVLKIIDPNKKSIYITKKDTIKSLYLANLSAGGLIPHQSELRKHSREYIHLSQQVAPLILPQVSTQGILNKKFFNFTSINQSELPLGCIDELINIFIEFAKRGIYNFDCKFTDMGIDEFGIFYALDSGSLKKKRLIMPNRLSIKDFMHLGINELARNRVLLNKFKNSSELIKYYDKQIKQKLNIDLSSFSLTWKWGDHADPRIKPVAQKFKNTLLLFKKKPKKTTYPLIDNNFQKIIANLIQNRYRSLNK